MRIVIALGGNALLHRGESPDAEIQRHRVREAARALAPLARQHDLVICHGNGPQVGMLAVESEADQTLSVPFPLDTLVAQTQGMIGYWLAQELCGAGLTRPAVAIIIQTVVDSDDPAFANPSKPIGSVYTRHEADDLAQQHRWSVARDGEGWRRVVASPSPLRVVESSAIDALLHLPAVVICGGGGGVPVVDDGTGRLGGVEAVVDKDRTAALIAADVSADRLVVLTDVEGVLADYGTPSAHVIRVLRAVDATTLALPPGSMGAKVAACAWFVEHTGQPAVIGALDAASAVIEGRAGTRLSPEPQPQVRG